MLVLLILVLSVFYARAALMTAREIARRDARARNLATAQLGARLIDAQCAAALAVVESLARYPREVSVQSHLREVVELIPALALVALYRPDGTLVASYPRSPVPPRSAVGQDWFEGVSALRLPYVSEVYPTGSAPGEPSVGLAVPVGPRSRPTAYLMALYQLRVVEEWLEPLQVGGDTRLYVIDADRHLIAASGGRVEQAGTIAASAPTQRALAGEPGAAEVPDLDGRGRALVGYFPAHVPGWAVVAVQPTASALAPADHLLHRLSLLLVPFLALMLGAGGLIERLYRRQALLTRQNSVLARDLAVQNERLRAADAARSEFLANVSHELRTPLASIKASVSGLLEPDINWDQESLRGFLVLVNEETDRLAARVRNLLDMARIEAGSMPAQREPCDLTDIVSSALERLQSLLRGRVIEAKFPSGPLLVEVDYAQIELVIVNLLENAVKYSPPGTPLHLCGEVCPAAGRAYLTVRDEGPGLAPGDEVRIFEKFYRAQVRGVRPEGTGLGLAICKAIVTAHGGMITARSHPEGGAEFRVCLPLYQNDSVEENVDAADPGRR